MSIQIKRRNGHYYEVRETPIIGTRFKSYEVVEPISPKIKHYYFSQLEKVGWLVTRRAPRNLDKLPQFSDERIRRISRYHKQLDKLHALVLKRVNLNLEA